MKRYPRNLVHILALILTLSKFVAASPKWHLASDGNEYLIEGDSKYNWLQAYDECTRRDLQLIVVNNSTKNAALDVLLRKIFSKSPDLWLGHHDEFNTVNRVDRPFYSISTGDKLTFSNWKNGEPNNIGGIEHCAHIYRESDYKWNDIACQSNYFGYICERRPPNTEACPDMEQSRQTAASINTQLSSKYNDDQSIIKQILEASRNNTNNILVELNKTTKDIVIKSKNSIDEIIQKKPYLQVVFADIGDSIKQIILEAAKEISDVSRRAQQTIDKEHLSAGESLSSIASDFKDKLDHSKNAIDQLFA